MEQGQKEQSVLSQLLNEVSDKSLQNILRKVIFSNENVIDTLLEQRPDLKPIDIVKKYNVQMFDVIVDDWRNRHNLNKATFLLMIECWRRVMQFQNGNLDYDLLTLSTHSATKNHRNLLVPSRGEIKSATNWYKLTEEGKKIVKDLMDNLVWEEKYNHIVFNKL